MNKIILYGSVGGHWWDEEFFTAAQVREQLDSMTGDVEVRINSGGGIVTEGQAIYTMLVDYPGRVNVVVDAVAASSASLIAMAGDTITMRDGAFMLIHDPAQMWTEGRGTEADHARAATQLKVIANAFAGIYAKRAGISRDEARQIMRDETVMDGAMALDLGFATATDDTPAEAVARFDYRIYANAPQELREASKDLGDSPRKAAVMAMTAGIARLKMETTMSGTSSQTSAGHTPAVAPVQPAKPDVTAASQAAVASERTRIQKIVASCAIARQPQAFADEHIEKGTSAADFNELVMAKWAEDQGAQPTKVGPSTAPAKITADVREKFSAGVQEALLMKVGAGGARNEFSSLSLAEMARESLIVAGENAKFTDRREMIGRAFTMRGMHSTSDFAVILENVAHRSVLRGWEEAPETFPQWTRKGTLTDFRPAKRVGLGHFESLEKKVEGAEYAYGTIGEKGEQIMLATYGKIIGFTRELIINDDMSILGDIPRKQGRAARRTIAELVFAVLANNPNMSDGVPLFDAAHNNLAASGSAPSVASLGAARAAMRVQKDGDVITNVTPKFILAPAALEVAIWQLLNSTVDPTATKGMASNPVAGMAELITDGRLDAMSATAWYLLGDPNSYDTIEVAYLDGREEPFLEQKTSWSTDGVELKVRIDAGVAPLAYQALYKNPGA